MRRGIRELLAKHGLDPPTHVVQFLGADYRNALDLDDGGFDLLISLYAGFVSEHCARYLRAGAPCL